MVIIQYEHERKDTRRHQPDTGRVDQPYMDSSVSSLRIENMELRRKIDDLETQATEMQQKHLKEASNKYANAPVHKVVKLSRVYYQILDTTNCLIDIEEGRSYTDEWNEVFA